MEVLVTGPDGLLGSNLIRELLDRNYSVSVLLESGKDPLTLKGLNIKRYYGNILHPETLHSTFKGKDVVFHCAASTAVFPARCETVVKVNVQGTKNVIDAALSQSIKRLIHVGSASSFGSGCTLENPGDETIPYCNQKIGLDYLDSKWEAQQLVLKAVEENKLPALVVNPTFMLGPYDSRPSSGSMILAIHNNKVPGCSSGGKNYVAVKDVAVAMSNAITQGRIGECYILGNHNLSYKDAFQMIASVIDAKPPKRVLPNAAIIAYATFNSLLAKAVRYTPSVTRELAIIGCQNHYYSSEKARRELDMPQTPIEQAISECYTWFNNNGYLDKKNG